MTFITPKPLAVMMITAMLTACGGSDWQTGIPGSGGTGDGNATTEIPVQATLSGTVEAVTATTVKINGVEYKITPQTKYVNSQTLQVGTSATVIVNPTTQEVVSIDQLFASDTPREFELTPLHEITGELSNNSFYQINTARSYTKITSPKADSLNDYHWLQTQYQRENATPITWKDISNDNKTLVPLGEWSLVNDKKLMVHFQENYAETMPNQPLLGKYSVIGSYINLASQGYPSGATAYNMQYTPYQDEYSIDPTATILSQTTLEGLIGEDKRDIQYGINRKNQQETFYYNLVGNASDTQGTVKFNTHTLMSQGCDTPSNPELNTCMSVTAYGSNPYPETGTWERIHIAGNDIIRITPPASLKDSLIDSDKADKILIKQANSTENVKIGKFYPANQPVNMTWYNQTAMDYILQQGLSTVVYK